MGAFVLVQQTPGELRLLVLLAVATVGAAVGACSAFVPRCRLRHTRAGAARA